MMRTTKGAPPDTLDRRRVLLLWYWPCALGPHIHLGYGLPRARVLTALGAALVTGPLLALLLLAGDQDLAAALAALLALPLALLSSGRRVRSWYLLAPHGRPTRYLYRHQAPPARRPAWLYSPRLPRPPSPGIGVSAAPR